MALILIWLTACVFFLIDCVCVPGSHILALTSESETSVVRDSSRPTLLGWYTLPQIIHPLLKVRPCPQPLLATTLSQLSAGLAAAGLAAAGLAAAGLAAAGLAALGACGGGARGSGARRGGTLWLQGSHGVEGGIRLEPSPWPRERRHARHCELPCPPRRWPAPRACPSESPQAHMGSRAGATAQPLHARYGGRPLDRTRASTLAGDRG